MCRSVQTVIEPWRGNTVGLSGLPAMKTMYETGARLFATDRGFYRRRKLILNLVEQLLLSSLSHTSNELIQKYEHGHRLDIHTGFSGHPLVRPMITLVLLYETVRCA